MRNRIAHSVFNIGAVQCNNNKILNSRSTFEIVGERLILPARGILEMKERVRVY